MLKHHHKQYITLRVNATLHYLKHIALCTSLAVIAILAVNMYKINETNTQLEVTLAALDNTLEGVTSDPNILQAKLDEIDNLKKENDIILTNNQDLNEKVLGLTEGMVKLDEENTSLLKSNEDQATEIENLTDRISKYEKYEYAVIDPDTGLRTDITYDQLVMAEDICEQNGVDVNLLLAMIMTESRGEENATSPHGAKGLAQMKNPVGKFSYEELMKAGDFKTEYLYDGDKNVEMAANYLCYLIDDSPTLNRAIDRYRGLHDESYYRKIIHFLSYSDTTLDQIRSEVE